MKFDKTIVILGPTASGKTGVAIEIAKEIERLYHENCTKNSEENVRNIKKCCTKFDNKIVRNLSDKSYDLPKGAEIISADSRAIYKYMDIGTAKPGAEEQDGVPHWGLDLVEPGGRFTVADWKNYAEQKIAEIKARGKVPIIAGGTGLYIDALVYGYSFKEGAKESQVDREQVREGFLLVGIEWSPEELRKRITKRADLMFSPELEKETRFLVSKYGWGSQAMKSNIYQFEWAYLQGEYDLERAKELFVFDDWHLAKRQLTWFKRNSQIRWLPLDKVKDFVVKYIQDEQRR